MYGVVTRNPEDLELPEFERGFYEVKGPSGRHEDPVGGAINMVSCFGDTAMAESEPDRAAVDAEGVPATRDQPYFDWGYVCPTAEQYREGLRMVIEGCTSVSPDVRLDDVGFPRREFCHCERCEAAFEASEHDDWFAWRASVITSFVAEATDRIPGKTYLTLYPDPYPGHLYERSGIDLDAVAEHVDEFVVPLYEQYATTYWLEILTTGFADLLDAPFAVELYAVDVDIDDLLRATEVAETYADAVYFGYDAGNARAALRRREAEANQGVSHGDSA